MRGVDEGHIGLLLRPTSRIVRATWSKPRLRKTRREAGFFVCLMRARVRRVVQGLVAVEVDADLSGFSDVDVA